jgi:hypothetical protein
MELHKSWLQRSLTCRAHGKLPIKLTGLFGLTSLSGIFPGGRNVKQVEFSPPSLERTRMAGISKVKITLRVASSNPTVGAKWTE